MTIVFVASLIFASIYHYRSYQLEKMRLVQLEWEIRSEMIFQLWNYYHSVQTKPEDIPTFDDAMAKVKVSRAVLIRQHPDPLALFKKFRQERDLGYWNQNPIKELP